MTYLYYKVLGTLGIAMLTFAPVLANAEGLQPKITVTGEGSVSAAPDMARINLGVGKVADSAEDAMNGMSEALEAVIAQLISAGVEPVHIQTGNLQIQQKYGEYDGGPQEIVGYIAASEVQIQVYELDRLGEILAAAVHDGATNMSGLQFDVVDSAPQLKAARQAAVADARAKAEIYAEAAGVTLGPILDISESGGSSRSGVVMADMPAGAQARSIPISAGELSIEASVSIVWTLIE